MHPLETSKLFYHIDTREVNLVAGYSGFSIGTGFTTKKQDGRSLKTVLLEVWENQPEARNPKSLENFWGILVSTCNNNARRARLTELLATKSIRHLLKPFYWSSVEIKEVFFITIFSNDPFALRDLWNKRPEWRGELGQVLLTCLRALCQTGYDPSREELYALWMSSKSTRLKKVALKPSEHSWVRILQDSEDACTVAVMVKTGLGTTYTSKGLQRCTRQDGLPILSRLETSLVINHQTMPYCHLNKMPWKYSQDLELWRSGDRDWRYYWMVTALKENTSFWITPRGRLKLVQQLSDTHLLLEYDIIKRDEVRKFLGVPIKEGPGHWEYTEDEDHPPVRLIPVHIRANA